MSLIEQDQHHRQLALDPSRSFIVQAPAGSGKTELLIQRLLVLLQYAESPNEVLAITFTKKAANEMRSRIINALNQSANTKEPIAAHAKLTWQLGKKVLERDQQREWNLLNNPNQLRILTIDSLCSYLTKQMPLLAQTGATPDMAETPHPLYHEAVTELLLSVENNDQLADDIACLLKHLDNNLNKLHKLLIDLLKKRDQWLPYLHLDASDQDLRKFLEQQLNAVINEHLQILTESFPTAFIPELIAISRFAANQLALNQTESPINACLDIDKLPHPSNRARLIWLGIAKILTTENDWRKAFDTRVGFPAPSSSKNNEEKATYQQFKKRASQLVEELQDEKIVKSQIIKSLLLDLKHLPATTYDDIQWQALKSLCHILKYAAAQLRLSFQLHGQIDFIENTQAAMLALGTEEEPTDLTLALDYQIKHILIDEFQDTSITQYRLLEKLTMGWEANDQRSLFIVGDPMQSIYRFREAEVGLFLRLREHGINHISLTPLVLSMNFRSTAKIVEWNNSHFQKIFPPFNDIATGAIRHTASISNNDGSQIQTTVNIAAFDSDDTQPQSEHIIKTIIDHREHHPEHRIAILVRARHHLKTIIPALKNANIPYSALDIDALHERQCIQDIMVLVRTLTHPYDRIAWLSLLRAPWCGLTLADLHVIGTDHNKTLFEQLNNQDIVRNLSADGRTRVERTIPHVFAAISQRQRHSLRKTIEQLWYQLGGPACLYDISMMDDVNAFFNLLDKIERNDEAFSLDKLKLELERLYANATHHENAVQLMTIHSAKGLEFDCVILPHLECKSANSESPLLAWMDRPLQQGDQALLLAPIHATGNDKDSIYAYINRQQQIKIDYEMSRLLYVATTRAKYFLHLLFNIRLDEQNSYQVSSGSLLKKLWPTLAYDAIHYLQPHTESSPKKTNSHPFLRLTSTWQHPHKYQHDKNASPHKNIHGFQLLDHKPKIMGTVIHELLQLLANNGISWWLTKSHAAQQHLVSQRLLYHKMAPNHIEECQEEIDAQLTKILNDPQAVWILSPHHQARAEYPISVTFDDGIKSLVIDRTFIAEDGTRWIIDYKTAAPSSNNVDEFLSQQMKKHETQLREYAQAFSLIEAIPIQLGLYFTAIPHFYPLPR